MVYLRGAAEVLDARAAPAAGVANFFDVRALALVEDVATFLTEETAPFARSST